MAIDTAPKRASSLSVAIGLRMVIPDSTLDQGDRQTLGFAYSGILAGEEVIVSLWTLQPDVATSWSAVTDASTTWTNKPNEATTWAVQ